MFLLTIGTVGFPRPSLGTDTLKLFIVEYNTLELQCPQTEPLKNIVCFQSGLWRGWLSSWTELNMTVRVCTIAKQRLFNDNLMSWSTHDPALYNLPAVSISRLVGVKAEAFTPSHHSVSVDAHTNILYVWRESSYRIGPP